MIIKTNKKQYRAIIFSLEMILYMARWQLSTFTMTPVILLAKYWGVIVTWEQVGLANLINAPFFYFVDKFILVHVRKYIQKAIDYFRHKQSASKKLETLELKEQYEKN